MKIGVFDSGIGGDAIAISLAQDIEEATIIKVDDKEHLPYGDKTQAEIIKLTEKALQPLFKARCDVIVIACNTATALAIDHLRSKYADQKFIGIEPMIKTATRLTTSRTIAVCATPATLQSDRYKKLVRLHGKAVRIIEPNCSAWAKMIEDNTINHFLISDTVKQIKDQGSDVIVLGCTHYHWIKDLISDLAGENIRVIEPSSAISKRVIQLLKPR